MPLLPEESQLYPPDLLDQAADNADGERYWWVVQTAPRQEKMLARQLTSMAIAHYVPQIAKTYRSPAGRKRTSYIPAFAGYAFAWGDDEERRNCATARACARILQVPDGECLMRDLLQIHQLTTSGKTLIPEDKLEAGVRVRVTSGPFKDFEGVILKRRTGDRLAVTVEYLQQGISVELEEQAVELL